MRYLTYLAFALPLLVFAACGDAEEAGPGEPPKVQVEDFEYHRLPEGTRILTGKLYNATTTPIRNAQIQVSLFDADNRRISSMTIHVQDIPPGERKTFRESVEEDDVHGARVRSVLVP